jgi:hypothetical protein
MRGDYHIHPADDPSNVRVSDDDMAMLNARADYYPNYRAVVVDKQGNLWEYSVDSRYSGAPSGRVYFPDRLLGNYQSHLVQYHWTWRAGVAGVGTAGGIYAGR